MSDVAARIAAAAGDASALLSLAIELANENARLAGHAAALEEAERERKRAAADKKYRQRHGVSRDVPGQEGTSGDIGGPSSPSSPPSLLPPTPPNNSSPSSPPSPASSAAAGEDFDAEAALLERIPEASRPAWAAQLRVAEQGMDGPPIPRAKILEACRDYLGNENLTGQRSLRHFRAYLAQAAKKAAEPSEARPVGTRAGADRVEAGNAVARIRELVVEINLPGQGTKRVLRAASVAELGEDIAAAFRTVGGSQRFVALDTKPEDLPFLIREFGDALRDARRQIASTHQHAGAA